MREESVLKLSIFTSVIGIILLFYATKIIVAPSINISESENYIGKRVLLKGKITSLFISDKGTVFMKIADKTGEIKAVIFKNRVSKISANKLEKSKEIELEGKIDVYKGELEIIVDKITFIE